MSQQLIPEKILPTILIVDDTPANIGVVAESLGGCGYRVLVAQDGEEGLQRAILVQPDLILLDVMMPALDGFEVCRRLKQQIKTRDIPVIFMTARTETCDKVTGFKAGAVDYVTKPLQIDEVIARVEMQLSLSTMQKRLELQNSQLQRYRERLEQRVAERTAELSESNQRLRCEIDERRKSEQNLQESRAQLRGLTARREEVREEERKYIAREVHDELGQILSVLQLNVSVIAHKFAADLPALREQLQETMMLTTVALDAVRNVAQSLRPSVLDMGIVSALEWLAGRFGSNTGIRCEVHTEEAEIQLDENYAIALFRIVQESLTNVARHARTDKVEITLVREGDDYVLKIRDNGAGFDLGVKKENSFGLVGIRERVLMLAGTVFINSQPGSGTEIVVRIPINNNTRKL